MKMKSQKLNESFQSNILASLINVNKERHVDISGKTAEAMNSPYANFLLHLPLSIDRIDDDDITVYMDNNLLNKIPFEDENWDKSIKSTDDNSAYNVAYSAQNYGAHKAEVENVGTIRSQCISAYKALDNEYRRFKLERDSDKEALDEIWENVNTYDREVTTYEYNRLKEIVRNIKKRIDRSYSKKYSTIVETRNGNISIDINNVGDELDSLSANEVDGTLIKPLRMFFVKKYEELDAEYAHVFGTDGTYNTGRVKLSTRDILTTTAYNCIFNAIKNQLSENMGREGAKAFIDKVSYLSDDTVTFDENNRPVYSLDLLGTYLGGYLADSMKRVFDPWLSAANDVIEGKEEKMLPDLYRQFNSKSDVFTSSKNRKGLLYPTVGEFLKMCDANGYGDFVSYMNGEIEDGNIEESDILDQKRFHRSLRGMADGLKDGEDRKRISSPAIQSVVAPVAKFYQRTIRETSSEGDWAKNNQAYRLLNNLYRAISRKNGESHVDKNNQNTEVRSLDTLESILGFDKNGFKDEDLRVAIFTDSNFKIEYVVSAFYPSMTENIWHKMRLPYLFGIGPNTTTKESLRKLFSDMINRHSDVENLDYNPKGMRNEGTISIDEIANDPNVHCAILIRQRKSELNDNDTKMGERLYNLIGNARNKNTVDRSDIHRDDDGSVESRYTVSRTKKYEDELKSALASYNRKVNGMKAHHSQEEIPALMKERYPDLVKQIKDLRDRIESTKTFLSSDIDETIKILQKEYGSAGIKFHSESSDSSDKNDVVVVDFPNESLLSGEIVDVIEDVINDTHSSVHDDIYSCMDDVKNIGTLYDAFVGNEYCAGCMDEYNKFSEELMVGLKAQSPIYYEKINDYEFRIFCLTYKKEKWFKEAIGAVYDPNDKEIVKKSRELYDGIVSEESKQDVNDYEFKTVSGLIKAKMREIFYKMNNIFLSTNVPIRIIMENIPTINDLRLNSIIHTIKMNDRRKKHGSDGDDKFSNYKIQQRIQDAIDQISDEDNKIRYTINEMNGDLSELKKSLNTNLYINAGKDTSVKQPKELKSADIWDTLKGDDDIMEEFKYKSFAGSGWLQPSDENNIYNVCRVSLGDIITKASRAKIKTEEYEGVLARYAEMIGNVVYYLQKVYGDEEGIVSIEDENGNSIEINNATTAINKNSEDSIKQVKNDLTELAKYIAINIHKEYTACIDEINSFLKEKGQQVMYAM